jgi:hypothetical protein
MNVSGLAEKQQLMLSTVHEQCNSKLTCFSRLLTVISASYMSKVNLKSAAIFLTVESFRSQIVWDQVESRDS